MKVLGSFCGRMGRRGRLGRINHVDVGGAQTCRNRRILKPLQEIVIKLLISVRLALQQTVLN